MSSLTNGMTRVLGLLLPLALVPATGAGQRFFDDFDGEDLGTHWDFGNPKGDMFYSVHDSLLEVYGFAGFSPQQWITARIGSFGDFELRAVVGWSDAPQEQAMSVIITGVPPPNPPVTAWMSFRRSARRSMNIIQAGFHDGPTRTADAPPGGFHEFRITRRGNVLSAYLDDELFLSGAGIAEDVRFVTLAFSGDRGMPAQLLVDSVSVVPESTSVAALAGCMAMLGRRRRRTRR